MHIKIKMHGQSYDIVEKTCRIMILYFVQRKKFDYLYSLCYTLFKRGVYNGSKEGIFRQVNRMA